MHIHMNIHKKQKEGERNYGKRKISTRTPEDSGNG